MNRLPVPGSARNIVTADSSHRSSPPGAERRTLKPQLGPVKHMDYASQRLAVASAHFVCIWCTATHSLLHRFGEKQSIGSLALSRCGGYLAVAAGPSVRIYDINTLACLFEYCHRTAVTSVSIAYRAEIVASVDILGHIQVHDIETGELTCRARHHPDATEIFIEHSGSFVVCECAREVVFYSVPDGSALKRFSHAAAPRPGTRPWSRAVLVGYSGSEVGMWDWTSGDSGTQPTCLARVRLPMKVSSIDIDQSSQGIVLATIAGWQIHRFELRSARQVGPILETPLAPLCRARFGESADTIYAAGGDASAIVMQNGRHVRSYCESPPIVSGALHASRRHLFVSDQAGKVTRYDLETGTARHVQAHTGSAAAVACAGDFVASGGWDGVVRLHTADLEPIATFEHHDGPVKSVAFDAAGTTLWAGTHRGRIVGYDVGSGKEVAEYLDHRGSIRTLAVSPSRKLLLSGDDFSRLLVRDLETGEILRRYDQRGPVYHGWFQSDDELLATCRSGVKLFNLRNEGNPVHYPAYDVRWFCRLHDGTHCAITLSGEIKIFDMKSGRCLRKLRINDPRRHRLVVPLGPDRLLTAGNDGCGRVFDYSLTQVASFLHLEDGVLWSTSPAGTHPGWFYTDKDPGRYFDVGRSDAAGAEVSPLDSERCAEHFALYNSATHVMDIVRGAAVAARPRAGIKDAPAQLTHRPR